MIKNHCKKQRILEVLFYLDYSSRATFGTIYPVLVRDAGCKLDFGIGIGVEPFREDPGGSSSHWGKVHSSQSYTSIITAPATDIIPETMVEI